VQDNRSLLMLEIPQDQSASLYFRHRKDNIAAKCFLFSQTSAYYGLSVFYRI
jgi:hypothetical protein